MFNHLHVIISNIYCRLAVWKPVESVAAVALGYAYAIADDDE